MYHLTDQQIDFIINDISARGVEMESLQQDLLDHVCCIIEQELEANGDFQRFYETTIKTFYKKELREIEEETRSLLTNKNYYAMKKIMIASGIISAALLTMGIALKFLHMAGASFGIVIGTVLFSFLFLPLMFTLKIKEKQQTKDKVLLGLGSLVGILISLAILFKIQHWPLANILGITSVGILILGYLPINLVTGIRNPDTKINTIVSSVLLIAGCGLFLSLARSPQGSKAVYIKTTANFVRNNQLVQNELLQFEKLADGKKMNSSGQQIIAACEELKSFILEKETGLNTIGPDFESKQAWLGETYSEIYFGEGASGSSKLQALKQMVKDYNKAGAATSEFRQLPDEVIITASGNERILDALNNLVQLELFVLQNEELAIL
jgi:hypothetical protein